MTHPNQRDQGGSPPLPGLELPPAPPSVLEAAVRRTLHALDAAGALNEANAARTALAIELAQVITTKRQSGRASTVGMDARVLMDLLDQLSPVEEGGVDSELRRALEAWTDHGAPK